MTFLSISWIFHQVLFTVKNLFLLNFPSLNQFVVNVTKSLKATVQTAQKKHSPWAHEVN